METFKAELLCGVFLNIYLWAEKQSMDCTELAGGQFTKTCATMLL